MGEWQPIETAPKNGTPILAYKRVDDENEMWAVIWWRHGAWRFGAHVTLRRDLEPSHWRELGPAPAAQRDMQEAEG